MTTIIFAQDQPIYPRTLSLSHSTIGVSITYLAALAHNTFTNNTEVMKCRISWDVPSMGLPVSLRKDKCLVK
jgi:hypothetical protein